MLEWIWFSVLTVIAVVENGRFWHRRSALFSDLHNSIGTGAATVAMVFSWPILGSKILTSIENALPQPHTAIHNFTAVFLLLFIGVCYLFMTFGLGKLYASIFCKRHTACECV